MKKKNGLSIFFIVVGVILLLIAGVFGGKLYISANKATVTTGDIKTISNAYDDELEIEVNSPILVREVKMAQYYKDNNGVRLVLANYPIDSFTADGTNYQNPKFYSEVESKVFLGEASLNEYKLDEEALNLIAYKAVQGSSLTQLTDLNPVKGFKYNLVKYEDAYITASDDWALGDVEITYYYLSEEDAANYTIAGNISGSNISPVNNALYKGTVLDSKIQIDLLDGIETYLIIGAVGVLLLIVGLIIGANSKKKNNNKINNVPPRRVEVKPSPVQAPQPEFSFSPEDTAAKLNNIISEMNKENNK